VRPKREKAASLLSSCLAGEVSKKKNELSTACQRGSRKISDKGGGKQGRPYSSSPKKRSKEVTDLSPPKIYVTP